MREIVKDADSKDVSQNDKHRHAHQMVDSDLFSSRHPQLKNKNIAEEADLQSGRLNQLQKLKE